MVLRVHFVASAIDDQIVFGYDCMLVAGVEDKCAASFETQIRFGEDQRINVIGIDQSIFASAVGESVDTVFCQRNDDFVRFDDIDRCEIAGIDGDVVQYEFNCALAGDFYDHGAVEFSGQCVCAGAGDLDIFAAELNFRWLVDHQVGCFGRGRRTASAAGFIGIDLCIAGAESYEERQREKDR